MDPLGTDRNPDLPPVWGWSTMIQISGCDKDLIKDESHLRRFLKELCEEIEMIPYGETQVKRFGSGELEGLSGFQFIETSSIVVHLDEFRNRAFIDIFSCKEYNGTKASIFAQKFFKGTGHTMSMHERF